MVEAKALPQPTTPRRLHACMVSVYAMPGHSHGQCSILSRVCVSMFVCFLFKVRRCIDLNKMMINLNRKRLGRPILYFAKRDHSLNLE